MRFWLTGKKTAVPEVHVVLCARTRAHAVATSAPTHRR